jgi:Methyltransferase small domain
MSAFNPVRALKNAVVPGGYQEKTILAGLFKGIRMNLDLRTQTQFYLGLFERELYPWMLRFAAGVRTVVDVGAGHGEYTLFALLKTDAERVVTFEPDPAAIEQLERNLDANHLARCRRLNLHTRRLGPADSPESISVNALTDSILPPCLLKVDIDGGEAQLLGAASSGLLRASGLLWVIETHSVPLEKACVSILAAHGYRTRVVPNAWWRAVIPEQRVTEQNRWLVATNDSRYALC